MSIFCAFSDEAEEFHGMEECEVRKQSPRDMKILQIHWIKYRSQNTILGSESNF